MYQNLTLIQIFGKFYTIDPQKVVNFTNHQKGAVMKSQKKFKILFSIFLLLTGLFAIIQMPLIGLPVLGGVITQGILGGFSGKVGPVVGGKWKDIDYMRGYVIPSNPNTAGQQTVRAKFAKLVLLARGLLSNILNVYWDPFYSNMSGFNAWISENYTTLDGSSDLQATSIISKGTLENLSTNTSTYATATGEVESAFLDTPVGNGLGTDYVMQVVYDKSTELFYFGSGSGQRSGGTVSVNIGTGKTATNLIVYIFAFRGTGASFVVSDSIGDVAAAV